MKNRPGKQAVEKKSSTDQAHLIALNALFEAARHAQAGRDLAVASMKIKASFTTDLPTPIHPPR